MFEAFIETYSALDSSDRKVLTQSGINLVNSLNKNLSDRFFLSFSFLYPDRWMYMVDKSLQKHFKTQREAAMQVTR